MCVPDLACARRELQNVDDRLVAGRSVLLKQRLALDSRVAAREAHVALAKRIAPSAVTARHAMTALRYYSRKA